MPAQIPARLSADGRTATWNPALSRDSHVQVEIELADGTIGLRTTMNSGRARVRDNERIVRILAAG